MDARAALSRGRLQPLRTEDDISEHMKVFASNRLTGRGMFVKIGFYFYLFFIFYVIFGAAVERVKQTHR